MQLKGYCRVETEDNNPAGRMPLPVQHTGQRCWLASIAQQTLPAELGAIRPEYASIFNLCFTSDTQGTSDTQRGMASCDLGQGAIDHMATMHHCFNSAISSVFPATRMDRPNGDH